MNKFLYKKISENSYNNFENFIVFEARHVLCMAGLGLYKNDL
jgi:hypothetical protein